MGLLARLNAPGVLQAFSAHDRQRLVVLCYHRVDYPEHRPWLDPELISATPEQFDEQMQLLARQYHPVTAEQVLEALEGGRSLPSHAVLVTVDDGYRDFRETIFPVSQRHGIRPVLFVPTAFASRLPGYEAFWWDQLYQAVYCSDRPTLPCRGESIPIESPAQKSDARRRVARLLKRLPHDEAVDIARGFSEQRTALPADRPPDILNWDELRQLARDGATLAAHTHTHSILSRITQARAAEEIHTSQALIHREIGSALPVFAFPDGKPETFTPDIVKLLQSEAFRLVFTTVEGSARIQPHCFACQRRVGVKRDLSLAGFHARLTILYDAWRIAKAWQRRSDDD